MTTSIGEVTESSALLDVVAGVDTHADTHHVAVLSMAGLEVHGSVSAAMGAVGTLVSSEAQGIAETPGEHCS